jgi:hypothetical protein
MREPGECEPAGEPVGQRKSPANSAEIAQTVDAATLRAVARHVHRGAWWRRVRRQGLAGAPGVAQALGILAVLSCLTVGGRVFLSGSPGLFRGGDNRVGAVDRRRDAANPESRSGMENSAMQAMKLSAAVVGVALSGSGALAQSAVEWKVSEGGNGYWYSVRSADLLWMAKRLEAESVGGHLATVRSNSEMQFVLNLPGFDAGKSAWIGFYRDGGYGAPWRWVTAEPFDFTPWASSQPCPCNGTCNCATEWAGLLVKQTSLWGTGFADGESPPCCGGPISVFEWSADCNSDGIVDYGQIVTGELDDTNANNIPDCCEEGTACPVNLAINGSFEAGTPLNACTSESVAAGTSIGTGWQVTQGSVQRVRASSACATQGTPKFGDFFIDLLDAGEIRQTVATTPGRSYRLTFWLSGDCAAGTSNGPLIDGIRVEGISTSCPGDVDGSGGVDGADISLVLLNFGDCPQ